MRTLVMHADGKRAPLFAKRQPCDIPNDMRAHAAVYFGRLMPERHAEAIARGRLPASGK